MAYHKSRKYLSTAMDIALAFLLFLFITFVVMSPTIGNASFYSRFASSEKVTNSIAETLKEKTDAIAQKTGIESQAFVVAVGHRAINSAKKDMMVAVFEGRKPNYNESVSIETRYREGIKEFYRSNGIDDQLNEEQLELAVELACDAFNESMGIKNNKEMNRLVGFMSKTSMILAVAILILCVVVAFKTYTMCYGSTRVLSHYASSLISAGMALVLLFATNMVLHFSSRLYLTSSAAINTVLNGGANIYFLILALFGAAFIVGGNSMMVYVYKHYSHKKAKQKQELDINRSLLVSGEDGDKTIEEIVHERREQTKHRHNLKQD